MKLHGNGAIFLLIFSEAKLSRIPATLPTPCDIIGQKAAFFDFLCADRKSAMSKKSSKIKGFRVRKKYFCEYLTHSDDLGRVVVPKEIRRTLRIREGDPLEIFTDREGEIILKKYSPIGELSAFAKQYAESLSQVLECLVGICDMDQVVAAAGNGKKEIQDEDITGELGEFLKERKTRNAKAGEKRYVPIVSVSEPYKQEVISPILCAGDVIGAVFLLNQERTDRFKDTELCLAEYTAKVLGKQMEQ